MAPTTLRTKLSRIAEQESLSPNLARALRAMVAFTVPLVLGFAGWLPLQVSFMAIGAQSLAIIDVRGAYRLRFAVLMVTAAVFIGAIALGTWVSGNLPAIIAATIVVAICGGWARHLSSDYGPSLAMSSMVLFLIALSPASSSAGVASNSLAATLGVAWGIVVQVSPWWFRSQHPLRRSVSDAWVAAADLFEAMNPATELDPGIRARRIRDGETGVRSALDDAYVHLSDVHHPRPSRLRQNLGDLNLAAARLVTRVIAFSTAIDAVPERFSAALAPSIQPVFRSLTNTARSTAITMVSKQPAHLAAFEVRLRRLDNLLRVVEGQVSSLVDDRATAAQLRELLGQIERQLPAMQAALRATIDRAGERAAFSLELLDVQSSMLRPLASALNFRRRVEPALVFFTIRTTVLTVAGVVAYTLGGWTHGYWLPLTMAVVLQPDYGSTRQRALQRIAGTLVGSLGASALLFLRPPLGWVELAIGGAMFGFGYFLKKNYTIAVVFITIMVILLMEARGPLTLTITFERLACTIAGGAVSLLAAMFFWPVWERDRLRPVLVRALDANRVFLSALTERIVSGGAYDANAIALKRQVESANSAAFSSLQRMMGDPKNQQEGLERAAALANGNQRLTHALIVIALHLKSGDPVPRPEISAFTAQASRAFDVLARALGNIPSATNAELEESLRAIENLRLPLAPDSVAAGREREHWIFAQLAQVATELGAMLLAVIDAPGKPLASASIAATA